MTRRRLPALLLFLLVALAGAWPAATVSAQPMPPAPAAAQPAETQPEAARTRAELEALIGALKDDAERQKLIARLELMLAAQRAEAGTPAAPAGVGVRLLAGLSDGVEWVSRDLVHGLRTIFDMRRLRDWATAQASRPESRERWINVLWKVTAAILAGLAAEWLVRTVLGAPRRALSARVEPVRWRRIPPLFGRAVLDAVPIAAFVAAGYAVLALVQPDNSARLVALGLMNAYIAAAVVLLLGRMVLSPDASGLRPLPIDDADANYLYVWLRRLAQVAIYGYVAAEAARLLGMPAEGAAGLLRLVGLFVALMLVVLILQNRASVASWIRGRADGGGSLRVVRARLGDVWHVLAMVYVLGMFVVWALAIKGGFAFLLQATVLTALILAATRLALAGLHGAAARVFALSDDVRARFPGLEARANRYLPFLERAGGVVIWAVALLMLLEAWGIDALALLASDTGRAVASSLATSAIVIFAAALVWEAASAWIERYLARQTADGAAASARARTLLPLLRTTLMVVLVVMAGLIVLSEFGVNIAPLLAGAGVVGLAVGFGSQALVRDVITGAFILAENQLAVGDVVRIGTNSGVVERLTLRTIWLRGMDGTVQVIPFGEVKTVENMTKDFSCYVFDVGVAYREDTDRVVELLKEIGAELQQDPAFAPLIVSPIEVMGVDSFGDNAVGIKARITTKPIQQWKVGREFNRRLKKRFDAEGIEMPFPHRTIYFGVDRQGNAPPARVALHPSGPAGDGGKAGQEPGAPAEAPARP